MNLLLSLVIGNIDKLFLLNFFLKRCRIKIKRSIRFEPIRLIQSPDNESETRAWQKAIEGAGEQRLLGTLHKNISDKVLYSFEFSSRVLILVVKQRLNQLATRKRFQLGGPNWMRYWHCQRIDVVPIAMLLIRNGRASIWAFSSVYRVRAFIGHLAFIFQK